MTRKKILDEDKVKKIVYAYDLEVLNIEIDLPETMRDFELTRPMVQKYVPSLFERSVSIAYDACYFQYMSQNPKSTVEEFKKVLDEDAVKKVADEIRPKLHKKPSLNRLKKFHEKKFSKNPTRVDLDRQVKVDE